MEFSREETEKEAVAVLGSTGSVGRQALEVALAQGRRVDLLTANRNTVLAEEQIRAFCPKTFVMVSEDAARDLAVRVADTGTRVLSSSDAVCEAIAESTAPTVIHAILGEAGLSPVLACIAAKKKIGLANKECLVIAGDIVMKKAAEAGVTIVPVDSEHSAIFQSLKAGRKEEIRSIILTASGGPFFGYTPKMLEQVTREQTLAHPTWQMGAKITVDSATLMNKGFEVIEAVRLFGVTPEQIQVVVHRESIIHSAVEYIDSAVIAQMGVPDMRLCVQYAMTYPFRETGLTRPLSLTEVGKLTFVEPDRDAFPLLPLAFSAIRDGGGVPAVLNAANEIAVDAFLHDRIPFGKIASAVINTVDNMRQAKNAISLNDRIAADREARRKTEEYLKNN